MTNYNSFDFINKMLSLTQEDSIKVRNIARYINNHLEENIKISWYNRSFNRLSDIYSYYNTVNISVVLDGIRDELIYYNFYMDNKILISLYAMYSIMNKPKDDILVIKPLLL